MDFNDLRADINLECPYCNRKFQQKEEAVDESPTSECPGCGQEVAVEKAAGETER